MLGWSLLSSDWTLSTARQALAPTGIGYVHKETKYLRKKIGRRFWIRAMLHFGVGINALNALFRLSDEKENPEYYFAKEKGFLSKTMWGNNYGHKSPLFVGRHEDGTERYIRPLFTLIKTGYSPNSVKPVTMRIAGYCPGTDTDLEMQVRIACQYPAASKFSDLLTAGDHITFINEPLI